MAAKAKQRAEPPAIAAAATPAPKEVMTAPEVAELLGCDLGTVYQHVARGDLPHRRLGRKILFGRRAVLEWLNKPAHNGNSA